MTAILIDGKAAAAAEKQRIAAEVERLAEHGVVPGLAAVLVGDDPASHVYVDGKERDCVAVGMNSLGARLPADITQEELHAELDRLNANPEVSGIIVQLPLPAHLDAVAAQERIDPGKDVDGLHPVNAGRLVRGDPLLVPATPLGCQVLLSVRHPHPRGKRRDHRSLAARGPAAGHAAEPEGRWRQRHGHDVPHGDEGRG